MSLDRVAQGTFLGRSFPSGGGRPQVGLLRGLRIRSEARIHRVCRDWQRRQRLLIRYLSATSRAPLLLSVCVSRRERRFNGARGGEFRLGGPVSLRGVSGKVEPALDIAAGK